MQDYGGNSSSTILPMGPNSVDDPYVLAKRMTLERQRSLTNPYAAWPGRDAASMADANDASLAHSKFPSSIAENVRVQHHPQNVDLLTVLQGLPDRSTSNANNAVGSWLNFSDQGRSDPFQDKLDPHQNQIPPQSAFGIQHPRQPSQNPSVASILGHSMDNPANLLTAEKLLSSGLPQDPQVLNMLQQQYLLQQLQTQAPVPPQQLSALDKFLLLKQHQQKQEEQQQLIRQQQQLLSQVLSEHQNQRLGELPLQTGSFATGKANVVDNTRFQQPHDLFHMSAQVPNMQDEHSNSAGYIVPPSVSQDLSSNIDLETSKHLPHQIFANDMKERIWDSSQKDQVSSMPPGGLDMAPSSEEASKHHLEHASYHDEHHLEESISEKSRVGREKMAVYKDANALAETPGSASEEVHDTEQQKIRESSLKKEVKSTEVREVKKSSEKKSRKQKSSKVSTDPLKGMPKSQQATSSESKLDTSPVQGDAAAATSKIEKVSAKDVDLLPGQNVVPDLKLADRDGVMTETYGQPGQVAMQMNDQTMASQRAWKPAPGFKPKSFLEIQQEEQRRAREEMTLSEISTPVSSMSIPSPWAGVVVNPDQKVSSESRPDSANTVVNSAKSDSSLIPKSKNNHDDLFWDSSVAKLGEREKVVLESTPVVPFASITSSNNDDNDFISAKDSKKNRKKAAKAKNGGSKVAPAAAIDSSPADKVKPNRQVQQEKEVLPAVPSGPSLGDFVLWKEEPASPSPAPAWSTDSGKPNKTTSLRDILKEQGKKGSSSQPIQTLLPQKPATNQSARGSAPSWSLSTSPAKAPAMQINSQASQRKQNVEDDLFWGPVEQSKPDGKQYVFIFYDTNILHIFICACFTGLVIIHHC